MAKVKIDGVEFEVSDQLLPVIASKLDSLVTIEKEKNELKGSFDALDSELKKFKDEKTKKDRNDFIESVKPLLPENTVITDSMTVREIKELVIKSDDKDAKFDGLSDDYVSGVFNMIVKNKKEAKKDSISDNSYASLKAGLSVAPKLDNKEHILDSTFAFIGGKR
jgi:hypothetical protein